MPLMREFQNAHEARHARAEAGTYRFVEVHRFAVSQEPVGLGRRWRRLATVIRFEGFRGFIPVHDKSAAPETRRLRLDKAEYELRRNRCIYR